MSGANDRADCCTAPPKKLSATTNDANADPRPLAHDAPAPAPSIQDASGDSHVMADPFRQNLLRSAPPRVSSEAPQLPASSSDSRRRSHLHGLPHPHRSHHPHRSSRHHEKEIVQSAFPPQPPTSFGDLLKQAKESISSTPSDSRRESVAIADGTADHDRHTSARLDIPAHPKPARPEDLRIEKQRTKVREQELRSALQSLSEQSLKTSRSLDDTYYSLLERIAACRQTIGSLQELSNLASELNRNFEADTKELVEEVEGQVDGLSGFETQKGQVEGLEERLKKGREKAEGLERRVEEARRKVDERAKKEAGLEARNTRHMRILWGIIGSFLGLVLLSIVFQQFKPVHPDMEHKPALDFASRDQMLNALIPDIAKEVITSPTRSQLDVRIGKSGVEARTETEDDARLRVFDEL